jgi:signal transduction histidine kinase
LAGILAKRASLYRTVASQSEQNHLLKSQMDQIQPLASIGLVSAMIAHELNNILTPLANFAQLAVDYPDDAALREKALRKTILNCERACKIQQSLLALANGQRQTKQPTGFRALIDEVFACLCRDFRKDKIEIVLDIQPGLTVSLVPAQIQQVIMNLVINAREAMLPDGGSITIKAWAADGSAIITVADTGSGISPEHLPRIFEPFFTTKGGHGSPAAGSGSGLGLAFCRGIIESHDGAITVESRQGQGTTFKIILPM